MAILPVIDVGDVLGEGIKLGDDQLALEGLHDEHDARFDHPDKIELELFKSIWSAHFWNWLKSSLMLSMP